MCGTTCSPCHTHMYAASVARRAHGSGRRGAAQPRGIPPQDHPVAGPQAAHITSAIFMYFDVCSRPPGLSRTQSSGRIGSFSNPLISEADEAYLEAAKASRKAKTHAMSMKDKISVRRSVHMMTLSIFTHCISQREQVCRRRNQRRRVTSCCAVGRGVFRSEALLCAHQGGLSRPGCLGGRHQDPRRFLCAAYLPTTDRLLLRQANTGPPLARTSLFFAGVCTSTSSSLCFTSASSSSLFVSLISNGS